MDEYIHDYIGIKKLGQLNVKELIYYCLAYPASYSQNCGEGYPEDKTSTPKIVGYLASGGRGAGALSELQIKQLEKNRDSVILVLNNYIKKNPDKIEDDYLYILKTLKSIESIPTIIQTSSIENRSNYSYLLILMKDFEYKPWTKTSMYNTLYGEKSWEYGSRIEATVANIDLIKKLATDFYNQNKK